MKPAKLIFAVACLFWTALPSAALAQTLTVGPVGDEVTLDAAALEAASGEVTENPDGSRSYRNIAVKGETWSAEISELSTRSTRGPVTAETVRLSFVVSNNGMVALNFALGSTEPATMAGDIGAGASTSLVYTDANFDAAGGASAVVDTIPVELQVDGVNTGVAVLETLALSPGFAGQTLAATGAVGLPGNGAAIPTPTTSIGIRAGFVLGPGDSLGGVAVAIAAPIGTLLESSATVESATSGAADEQTTRHIVLETRSQRGVSADPIRVVSGNAALTNNAGVPLIFDVSITLPVTPLGAPTVMGGSVGIAYADGNFDGLGSVAAAPGVAFMRGRADGVDSGFELLAGLSQGPTQAGDTFAVVSSLGLPGPSIAPAPTIAANIGLIYRFQLSPGDSAAVSGVFAIGTPACPLTAAVCTSTFEKGVLKYIAKEGKEKLIAVLSKGPMSTQASLGNPLAGGGTAYNLCIYDDASALVGTVHVDRAGDDCGGKPCWTAIGAPPPDGKGYIYIDKALQAGGTKLIKLSAGNSTKAKLAAKNSAKNGQLHLASDIAAKLVGATSATVQIHGSDVASCHSVALDTVLQADEAAFKGKR